MSGDRPTIVVLPPRENVDIDRRACLSPDHAKKLVDTGWHIRGHTGMGSRVGWANHEYVAAGVELTPEINDEDDVTGATVVLTREPLSPEAVQRLESSTVVLGFLEPFEQREMMVSLRDRGITSLALELVPRTTIAQPMDALSSQASLAGYAMVLMAADRLGKALPMMSTAAGTIRPARVLVIGTGVAGLQAIATAQRLGARVTAYDVRDTARQQVESLGAQFAKIDLGEDSETTGGYAKALTEEQLERQRQQLAKLCAQSDVIVCTAQVFGRRAPVIVTSDMLDGMAPYSVVVDGAAAAGGNVECGPDLADNNEFVHMLAAGETGSGSVVHVLRPRRPAARVARDASFVLSGNIHAILSHVFPAMTTGEGDAKTTALRATIDAEDEITRSMLATHAGRVPDERVASALGLANTEGSSA